MRKNAKKYITLICNRCGKEFNRELREYTRAVKTGCKSVFCSKECVAIAKTDIYSPFRKIFQDSKHSAIQKTLDFAIDLPFLLKLWNHQNGRCAYTSIKMTLPDSTYVNIQHNLIAASLDRIDSSKGYIKDNVEFVCRFINLGKNGYSKEETKQFIDLIKNRGSMPE